MPTPVKLVRRRSPSCFSVVLGGGMTAQDTMATGYRCVGDLDVAASLAIRPTAEGSKRSGIHTSWPSTSFGLRRAARRCEICASDRPRQVWEYLPDAPRLTGPVPPRGRSTPGARPR